MTEPRFLEASIAIDSFRDNGYKNTAYALAELIDNSIQAKSTRVDLCFFESENIRKNRTTFQLSEIAICDNGIGMDADTLRLALKFGGGLHRNDAKGMGKFGMGLPNSSISQCKRVDVWSWQNSGTPHYSYLDVDEMKSGELELVPNPVEKELPEYIVSSVYQSNNNIPSSGTVIVWSKLDRLNWKTGKSVHMHCETLVGRMYRKFITGDQIKIASRTFRQNVFGSFDMFGANEESVRYFKPNDPLYLMKDTTLPELPGDYNGEAFFEKISDYLIDVIYTDRKGNEVSDKVRVVSSVVKQTILDEILSGSKSKAGATIWGKHCAKNIGVSVLRSGREIVLDDDFFSKDLKEYKGRFIGIEIDFPPSLDDIFGITNNKQEVVNFKAYDTDELARQEGFDDKQDYLEDLKSNDDPMSACLQIIDRIKLEISSLVKDHLDKIRTDPKLMVSHGQTIENEVSRMATIGSNKIDKEDNIPEIQVTSDKASIVEFLQSHGQTTQEEAEKAADEIMLNGYKYHIHTISSPDSTAFFDVSTHQGLTLVNFNRAHPFYSQFMEGLSSQQKMILELAIAGFAKTMNAHHEDEKKIKFLNKIRLRWGSAISTFLEADLFDEEDDF